MHRPAAAQANFKHIHSMLSEANNSDDRDIRALMSELNNLVQKKRQHASSEPIAYTPLPRSHVPVQTQPIPAAAEQPSKRFRGQIETAQKSDSRHDTYVKDLYKSYLDCSVKILSLKLSINPRYSEYVRIINSLRKENLLDKKISDNFCHSLTRIYKEILQELIEIFNDQDAKNTESVREKTTFVMRCVGRLNLTQLSDKYLRDKFVTFCDQLEITEKLVTVSLNDLTRLATSLIPVVDDFISFMTRIDDVFLAHHVTEKKMNPRYKTILCRDWFLKGNCIRGNTCKFAHDEHDLAQHKR